MKTNDEIYNIVMDRRDEYIENRRVKNKRIRSAGVAVLAIAVFVTVGTISHKKNTADVQAQGEERESVIDYSEISTADVYEDQTEISRAFDINSEYDYGEYETETVRMEEKSTIVQIYHGADVPDNNSQEYEGSGEITGGFCIPVIPEMCGAENGVVVTGEKISDEEAISFLKENTWIVSSLSASGVATDDIRYSDKGYCHVSYDGTEGKQLEVKQNFRDFLVYNNDELVAIVTLTKENGTLNATPAFGGPHFKEFNDFLQKHKGEKLLFVYASFMEIIITPDGECMNPQGYDVSEEYGLDALDNPYDYFYSEEATYIP